MKDTNKNIKFQDGTLELFLKTMTKIMQKVTKEELKNFEKHYTEDVLTPALEKLRSDLESKISGSTATTSESFEVSETSDTSTENITE